MSETHHYHKYHDGVPVTSTNPLRARLEKLFAEILQAVDERAAKPEPELTDDQIIAELEKLSRINSDEDDPISAFYKQAAKRLKLALAEIKELKEAILDYHVLANTGSLCDFAAINRLHEIGDIILKSRKGGNQ
jgi:hypothetical protein